ncbi:hypothetical protein [Cellulomonas bogoriensis]|uniref:hypothetical protein n=1 Tax=Cellulomonas bogoriensis TaxID=301388 RepID=UPI0012EC01CB|nr:hypothetical protein [Cellulomonas bogoriensis]
MDGSGAPVVVGGGIRVLEVECLGGGTARRWEAIEERLREASDRWGGHLVAVGPHDWPEP